MWCTVFAPGGSGQKKELKKEGGGGGPKPIPHSAPFLLLPSFVMIITFRSVLRRIEFANLYKRNNFLQVFKKFSKIQLFFSFGNLVKTVWDPSQKKSALAILTLNANLFLV